MTLAEQFVKRVKWVVDELTGCWNVTTGQDNGEGYKYISYRLDGMTKDKRIGAHRMAYTVYKGPIDKGKLIMHTCDNRACVNPDHLIMGTKKDNTVDMIIKKRVSNWKERKGKRRKLTINEISEIRRSNLSSYQLAKSYPVSATQIRRIRNGSRCRAL